jgi:hypothetical protein
MRMMIGGSMTVEGNVSGVGESGFGIATWGPGSDSGLGVE